MMKLETLTAYIASMNHYDDGATLEKYQPVQYSGGYQVALTDYRFTDPRNAAMKVIELQGNAGIWYDGRAWCIDHSLHVDSYSDAMRLALRYNQQSIWGWDSMESITV